MININSGPWHILPFPTVSRIHFRSADSGKYLAVYPHWEVWENKLSENVRKQIFLNIRNQRTAVRLFYSMNAIEAYRKGKNLLKEQDLLKGRINNYTNKGFKCLN